MDRISMSVTTWASIYSLKPNSWPPAEKVFPEKISLELAVFHAAFQIRYIIICIKMCPHGNPASAAVSVLLSLSSSIPPRFPSLCTV